MVLFYGVIGSAISFKKKYSRWDGSSEYYRLLWALCRRENIDQILLISKNDWNDLSIGEKKSIDPYGKVGDVISSIPLREIKKKYIKKSYQNDNERLDSEFAYSQYLVEFFKNNDWDFSRENKYRGLFFASQGMKSPIAVPGQLRIKKGAKTRGKVLAMAMNYSSPILQFINWSKIDWDLIGTDPRYVGEKMYPRGISNPPKNIFAQKTFKTKWETLDHWNSYDDYSESEKEFQVHYAEVEKINLISEPFINEEKTEDLVIVANNLCAGEIPLKNNKRFKEIKKFILDKGIKCDIYGSWPQEVYDTYPQFKGPKPGDEIDRIMAKAKFTVLFPLEKGWLSSKYGEMLRLNVLPLLHPDYDIQNNSKSGLLLTENGIETLLLNHYDDYVRETTLKGCIKDYIPNPPEESIFSRWNSIIGREVY